MKWGIVIIALLVSLGVGYALLKPSASEHQPDTNMQVERHETASANGSADARKIRQLEGQVRKMEKRLSEFEARLRSARRASSGGRAIDEAAIDADAPRPRPGEGTKVQENFAEALSEDDSPVRQGVVQIIRDEMRNAHAERREMHQAYRAARDDERLETFSEEAELDDKQISAVQDIMGGEREAIGKVFSEARENFDFRNARERARAIHAETDEAVTEVLSAEQLVAWGEMRKKQRRGRHR